MTPEARADRLVDVRRNVLRVPSGGVVKLYRLDPLTARQLHAALVHEFTDAAWQACLESDVTPLV